MQLAMSWVARPIVAAERRTSGGMRVSVAGAAELPLNSLLQHGQRACSQSCPAETPGCFVDTHTHLQGRGRGGRGGTCGSGGGSAAAAE